MARARRAARTRDAGRRSVHRVLARADGRGDRRRRAVRPRSRRPPPDVEVGGWPRVQVVDRREEPPGSGLLSEALATALHHAGGLAVCVLNRRGRFRLLVCASCQHLLRWDRPDERPLVCPECGATKLRVLRSGVTRVREELEALVPSARVAEVDTATAEVPDADILIGTEAVLHRAAVRRRRPALVAYLDLDQELLAPRYRAAAQAHWLLTRGAQLLSARPRRESLLLLQTRIPDHVVVQALRARRSRGRRRRPRSTTAARSRTRRSARWPSWRAPTTRWRPRSTRCGPAMS